MYLYLYMVSWVCAAVCRCCGSLPSCMERWLWSCMCCTYYALYTTDCLERALLYADVLVHTNMQCIHTEFRTHTSIQVNTHLDFVSLRVVKVQANHCWKCRAQAARNCTCAYMHTYIHFLHTYRFFSPLCRQNSSKPLLEVQGPSSTRLCACTPYFYCARASAITCI